jgi:TM2 domain-containing membrane protein YozV
MHASEAQRIMAYDAQKKSVVVAYLLWWFLGSFGAHRFYMGRVLSAVCMLLLLLGSLVLTLVFVGFLGLGVLGVWWLVDAFLIPGYIRRNNMRLAARLG